MTAPNLGPLAYLPAELRDNAITAHPLFIVEERDRVFGMEPGYATGHEDDDESGQRIYYVDRWRFVTAALTRKACQEYIDATRHNLTEPRIYVASAYRNREWIALRELFLGMASADEGQAACQCADQGVGPSNCTAHGDHHDGEAADA